MITREEIIAWQKARDEFQKTVAGAAFYKFKNAHHKAVTMDTEDSLTDKDRASTKKALEDAVQAERELLAVLGAAAELIGGVK
jgi:hypothetical protein